VTFHLQGVYGAYFSKLNYRWSRDVRNRTWLKSHPVIEVLLVRSPGIGIELSLIKVQITLITTLLCFVNPFTKMGGTELVYNLFAECRKGSENTHFGLCVLDPGSMNSISPIIGALLLAMVIKGALTVVTFGIKVPAGIFIPTLGVGACAGRVLGILMQYAQSRTPDAPLFRSCKGNLDCECIGGSLTLSSTSFRYHPRSLCNGWCSRHIIGCHGDNKASAFGDISD
jgi:chloride channel 3/4/5